MHSARRGLQRLPFALQPSQDSHPNILITHSPWPPPCVLQKATHELSLQACGLAEIGSSSLYFFMYLFFPVYALLWLKRPAQPLFLSPFLSLPRKQQLRRNPLLGPCSVCTSSILLPSPVLKPMVINSPRTESLLTQTQITAKNR